MGFYVSYVNTAQDCAVLSRFFTESVACRMPLYKVASLEHSIPEGMPLWIDPAVDAFVHSPERRDDAWTANVSAFAGWDEVDAALAGKHVETKRLEAFAEAILGSAASRNPAWLSVPQLPIDGNAHRGRVNRAFATAAGEWRDTSGYKGRVILPVIIEGLDAYRLKADRDALVRSVESHRGAAGANGVWIVDSKLSDYKVTSKSSERFAPLVQLHEQLRGSLGKATLIAGPYWGLNLVLWARGLVDYAGISMGVAYQYYPAAGYAQRGLPRVVLPPLMRLAVASITLKDWLEHALESVPPSDKAYSDLNELRQNVSIYSQDAAEARSQVTEFYRAWLNKLEFTPPEARALVLYEDLSHAYVLGKALGRDGQMPGEKGYAARPYAVAETLMLLCL